MSWTVERVSGPASEPLTTTEAKSHLRVRHSDDDSYIDSLVSGWRRWLEEETNRTYVKTTWDLFRDDFPESSDDEIPVPRGPVISVSSVKYTTTTATTAQTLSATKYFVDTASEPARIALRSGDTWPTEQLKEVSGVEVRYEAGFATSATGVPADAKNALRLLTGHSYVNREAVVVGSVNTRLKQGVEALVGNLDARRYT